MSAAQKVDVLAVLKRDAAHALGGRDPESCSGRDGETSNDAFIRFRRESMEARAAVGELIEASLPFSNGPDELSQNDDHKVAQFVTPGQIRRLRAALARIGGDV